MDDDYSKSQDRNRINAIIRKAISTVMVVGCSLTGAVAGVFGGQNGHDAFIPLFFGAFGAFAGAVVGDLIVEWGSRHFRR